MLGLGARTWCVQEQRINDTNATQTLNMTLTVSMRVLSILGRQPRATVTNTDTTKRSDRQSATTWAATRVPMARRMSSAKTTTCSVRSKQRRCVEQAGKSPAHLQGLSSIPFVCLSVCPSSGGGRLWLVPTIGCLENWTRETSGAEVFECLVVICDNSSHPICSPAFLLVAAPRRRWYQVASASLSITSPHGPVSLQ